MAVALPSRTPYSSYVRRRVNRPLGGKFNKFIKNLLKGLVIIQRSNDDTANIDLLGDGSEGVADGEVELAVAFEFGVE